MDAVSRALIKIDVAGILADLTARTVAANYRGVLLERGGESDACVGYGFTSGDYCELRETIKVIGAAAFEILERIVIADFGAILEAHHRGIYGGDRADGADAALDRAPGFRDIRTSRADDADASDG